MESNGSDDDDHTPAPLNTDETEDSASVVSQITYEPLVYNLDARIPALVARLLDLCDSGSEDGIEDLLAQVLQIIAPLPPTNYHIGVFVGSVLDLISEVATTSREREVLGFIRRFGEYINFTFDDGAEYALSVSGAGDCDGDSMCESGMNDAESAEEVEGNEEVTSAFEADHGAQYEPPELHEHFFGKAQPVTPTGSSGFVDVTTQPGHEDSKEVLIANTILSHSQPRMNKEPSESTVTQEDVSPPTASEPTDSVEMAEEPVELRRSGRIKAMKRKHSETE